MNIISANNKVMLIIYKEKGQKDDLLPFPKLFNYFTSTFKSNFVKSV